MADVSRVELRIQRMVLEGLPLDRRHAAAVREAVEAELTRLVGQGGLGGLGGVAGGERGRLRAPDVTLAPGGGPTDLGRRIAAAVHGGLAGQPPQEARRS